MMLLAHTAQAPGEECGSMMQAAELVVLDWLQAHLRCDFLDAVMPWISRICDHGEIWILLAAVLLPWFVQLVEFISPKGPELEVISRQIANAHTAFNVCCALLWLPFLPWMVRLVCALVPEKEKK